MDPAPAILNLDEMFPDLEHQPMRYVLHMCGLRDIPSQTRLIEFEGLEDINELANYTDSELDAMADRNSKRSPAPTRVQMGLSRTKKLKAVKFWITKKLREDAPCDLVELTDAFIGDLIREMSLTKSDKDSDSKLYYPDAFSASDYKNWIKKVSNYLDSRRGKAGVPLSYVIRPADVNPDDAQDEYTRALWAASFDTPQFKDDNREVYHLFKDLLTKTDGATWFEKVTDGDGRAAHLLLREHYVGEAHDMRRAASANAKLEALFWKSEASFPFEKYLTRMNEAFKELADAGQPMYMQQKVQLLLRSIKCDDIQVQTTMGIIRDRYLNDFDAACLTVSRTVSSRFASIEPGKNKRSIGATTTNTRNTRGSGGRGRGRGGGRGNQNGGRMKVMMNGVDVSDIHRNFTSDEWDKLRMVGGHTYIYQRREYLNNRGSGRGDGRGGGGRGSGRGYGDRGSYSGRGGRSSSTNDNRPNEPRAIATAGASNSTEIVEYDADAGSNVSSRVSSNSGSSDRGGRAGGRFGPRRDQQY
ncbi:hypothetical protein MHU86_24554 [Fragilaria crotonensis]|nr:hypothetical protein MHU86_24554 [Fragilaria crotonensis]